MELFFVSVSVLLTSVLVSAVTVVQPHRKVAAAEPSLKAEASSTTTKPEWPEDVLEAARIFTKVPDSDILSILNIAESSADNPDSVAKSFDVDYREKDPSQGVYVTTCCNGVVFEYPKKDVKGIAIKDRGVCLEDSAERKDKDVKYGGLKDFEAGGAEDDDDGLE